MTRTTLPFALVDVFAVDPLTGNPLAVVDGADGLPIAVLQRIAREFNLSETTFILPPTRPEADWRLRSFTTAGVEVIGAGGHNTLGAWWWLAERGTLALRGGTTVFQQEIGERVLPVAIERDGETLARVVMDQEAPVAGATPRDLDALAAALGLVPADLAVDRVPSQVVFTGAAHLMVPIRTRDAVDRAQPDAKTLLAALRAVDGEGCYIFSLDTRLPNTIAYARFFNPTVGIAEDPATGTAAGPLATHLVAHRVAPSGRMLIEQGTALGRTSLIEVEVRDTSVKVSAHAVTVATGELRV